PGRTIEQEVRERGAGVDTVLEEREVDKAVRPTGFDSEEHHDGDDEDERQADHGGIQPSQRVSLPDDDIQGHHGDDKRKEPEPVEPWLGGGLHLVLGCALEQEGAAGGDGDRYPEDPPPPQGGRNQTTEERTESRTAPRADGPEAHGTLSLLAIEGILQQGERG